jgi:hypothetical protein
MRQAIFLVEDIEEEGPVTLLESVYGKLKKYLEKNGPRKLGWLGEFQQALWIHPADDITFIKASDFVKVGIIPKDKDVYYFISCYHNLSNFTINNFLAMDPEVSDFLVEHNIPIILDCSLEVDDNYYGVTNKLFENFTFGNPTQSMDHASPFFRNLNKLEFYIVGSTHFPEVDDSCGIIGQRNVKVYHGMFPSCFFFRNTHTGNVNTFLIKHRQEIIDTIRARKITDETKLWRALSSEPRFTRSLFQLKAEDLKLTDDGEYSRLLPAAETFRFHYNLLFTNEHDWKRVKYVTEETINSLDQIKIIDKLNLDNENVDYYKNKDFMVWVVLETAYMNTIFLASNTATMVTEKSMQPIISGHPFIPYGGQDIGNTLKSLGFKEYPGLEFPTQQHILDELEHVTNKLLRLKSLSVEQRNELYETWKEVAVHNFNTYLDINIQRKYLDNLELMKSRGT